MAEVYLGTHQALGGFRKLVVMKRLLGWQRDDGAAVESLLDEARIAATMNHPNIVTTLDIGLDNGSPYIVLEYLSGEDLRFVLQQMHERDAIMPIGVACRIGAAIAAALSQAHDLKLPDGSRRCIVHRDVTPSNIIVCYSGVTKLVDFGVARVVDDANKTKSGMVKGKFSYLAPEQLKGDPLDGRTDVFQLGIVLWEMVTTQRLFEGKSDHERVNAILNRRVRPPSEINPALPGGLERTILRALERNPALRHQSAAELEAELLDAAAAIPGSGGDQSISKWMQKAFAARYVWRQELESRAVAEASENAETLTSDDEVQLEIEGGEAPWSRRKLQTGPTLIARDAGRTATGSSLRGVAVEGSIAAPRRTFGPYLVAAIVVAAAGFWWWRSTSKAEPEAAAASVGSAVVRHPDYDVDIRVTPATASISVDGVETAKGHFRGSFPDNGADHAVSFSAPDHATVLRRFHSATTLEVALEPLAPPAAAVPTTTDTAASSTPVVTHAATTHRRHDHPVTAVQHGTPAPAGSASAEAAPGANGSNVATPPPAPKPKPADDPFAPNSDNLDPFKK